MKSTKGLTSGILRAAPPPLIDLSAYRAPYSAGTTR